jgi:hypothetical protein
MERRQYLKDETLYGIKPGEDQGHIDMINKNYLIASFVILGVILFCFAIMKTDSYFSFLFDQLCKSKAAPLYGVNTHNIENVNFWYRLLYRNGSKANKFLKRKFWDKTETSIVFNGWRMRKCDISVFLYLDINYDDSAFMDLLHEFNFDNRVVQ